jgi:hypothetical protein
VGACVRVPGRCVTQSHTQLCERATEALERHAEIAVGGAALAAAASSSLVSSTADINNSTCACECAHPCVLCVRASLYCSVDVRIASCIVVVGGGSDGGSAARGGHRRHEGARAVGECV